MAKEADDSCNKISLYNGSTDLQLKTLSVKLVSLMEAELEGAHLIINRLCLETPMGIWTMWFIAVGQLFACYVQIRQDRVD